MKKGFESLISKAYWRLEKNIGSFECFKNKVMWSPTCFFHWRFMSVERSQGHEIPSFVFVWHSGGYFQLIPVMMVPTNFAVVTGEWTQGAGHCTIPPGWRLHKRRPRAGRNMLPNWGGQFFFKTKLFCWCFVKKTSQSSHPRFSELPVFLHIQKGLRRWK